MSRWSSQGLAEREAQAVAEGARLVVVPRWSSHGLAEREVQAVAEVARLVVARPVVARLVARLVVVLVEPVTEETVAEDNVVRRQNTRRGKSPAAAVSALESTKSPCPHRSRDTHPRQHKNSHQGRHMPDRQWSAAG